MTEDSERERELHEVPIRKTDKSTWPRYVRPIALKELDALGVDKTDQLYWHGEPLQTRRRFEVRGVELFLLAAATLGTLLQGVAAMFPFIPARITSLFGF